MHPITKEEYEKLTRSLSHLASIFKNMGIVEFSITKENRAIKLDNSTQLIEPDILHRFCDKIDALYESEQARLI